MPRAFLLKIGSGSEPIVYKTVAGLRVTSEEISAANYVISGTGIFLGSAAEARVRANAMAGTLDDYELSFEDGEKLRGRFLVQKLDYAGDFNGGRNYHVTLSGKVHPA